jgi:diguanylate cyclase (GGDEF)-like protein
MPKLAPALPPSEPDPSLLLKLGWIERACLAAVATVVAANLAGLPALGRNFPNGWQVMKAESAFTILVSALGLKLSEARQSRRMQRLSQVLAVLVTLLAAAILFEYRFQVSPGLEQLSGYDRGSAFAGRMSPQSASGFALLGIAMSLARARRRFAVRLADLFTFCLCLVVLVLVSGYIFGALNFFGSPTSIPTSPQTLFCLTLLTVATIVRRTENGVFSIFLGRGIGGKIARFLSPIVLVLPFLRETSRSHILNAGWLPAHYATAALTSLTAILSLGLLLFLAWRIDGMEMEIHGLTLRDELTGLYNLRGFSLLAEQELRVAHRSKLPFSVLFIDLDNLKQINDSLGHSTGSEFLTETGEILQATFRESDVLGRIGGDEFAVVGQFDEAAISSAARRLEQLCAQKNKEKGRGFALSFSVGHVTSNGERRESLDELLTKADQAMYEEKRRKKILVN